MLPILSMLVAPFTLPSVASTTDAIATTAGALFTDLIFLALAGLGLIVAGMGVAWITSTIWKALKMAFKRGGKGRGRRGRR